ncbi:uncharacterized protein METZ01_LOCUS285433, partial [marine metagenome]
CLVKCTGYSSITNATSGNALCIPRRNGIWKRIWIVCL